MTRSYQQTVLSSFMISTSVFHKLHYLNYGTCHRYWQSMTKGKDPHANLTLDFLNLNLTMEKKISIANNDGKSLKQSVS